MKRLAVIVALAAFTAGGVAYATTTWVREPLTPLSYSAQLGTSNTPDETNAPSAATDGFDLEAGKPFVVTVEPAVTYSFYGADVGISGWYGDGGAIKNGFDGGDRYPTPGVSDSDPDAAYANLIEPRTVINTKCHLRAWRYNPAARIWARDTVYDLFPSLGLAKQSFSVQAGYASVLPVPFGRIAYTPYGCEVPLKIHVGR